VHHIARYDAPTMPTTNPRITITLPPALHAQLRRISELTGNSQSALVSSLLETNTEVFARLITVLEAAEDVKEEMRTKVAEDMKAAQGKLEAQMGLSLDLVDAVTGDLVREAEEVRRRRARRSAQAPSARRSGAKSVAPTPMSNRGVRSGGKTAKKSTRTRG
jgi:sensor domain CHASE-containing protein